MNRRKAIMRISLGGAGLAAAFGGYEWFNLTKSPDVAYVERNRELLAALAETIIPATDTPGAREAGVADFIVMMIRECTERKSQNKFITGLKDLQDHCEGVYKRPYQHLEAAQQESVLALFEKKSRHTGGIVGKVQDRYLGKSFFTILKEYTVEGYCTSEAGATRGLAYVNVPGKFQGCVPMLPGQKGWATN